MTALPSWDIFQAYCIETVSKHVRRRPQGKDSSAEKAECQAALRRPGDVTAEQPGAVCPRKMVTPIETPGGRSDHRSVRPGAALSLRLTLDNKTMRGVSPGKGLSAHLEKELASHSQEWGLLVAWSVSVWMAT